MRARRLTRAEDEAAGHRENRIGPRFDAAVIGVGCLVPADLGVFEAALFCSAANTSTFSPRLRLAQTGRCDAFGRAQNVEYFGYQRIEVKTALSLVDGATVGEPRTGVLRPGNSLRLIISHSSPTVNRPISPL